MLYRFLITLIFTAFGFYNLFAQRCLLNTACQIQAIQPIQKKCNTSYMWYPGQLSAHLQIQQKEKSAERCVNVGYPGKFNPAAYQVFFCKQLTLKQETKIEWCNSGTATCFIDNVALPENSHSYTLKKGTHTVLFEIKTKNRLPALILNGKNIENMNDWQVSLDNKHWNIPETDERYNCPAKFPDSEQEIITTVFPDKYIHLQNTTLTNNRLAFGQNAQAVIDFRHLEVGNVKLLAAGKGKLTFTVGESEEEALNDNQRFFEQRPIPSCILRDTVQEILLPEQALRYLRIESEQPCILSNIRFEAKLWNSDLLMQFECDNDTLNNLWKVGVATIHSSMHNFYLDGIKRDYLPWSMDAVVSALAGDYLFGDRQVSRNGLSIALLPPNPQIADLGIIDYPLHALIGLKQDYLRYGDITTSFMFKDRIIQQLALYESLQYESGFLSSKLSATGFIPGWDVKMGPSGKGIPAYAQILLYQNFMIGSYFAALWNDNDLSEKYKQKAEILRANILKHFWDERQKAFINGYLPNGEKDIRISHHAQYWAVLADLFPAQYIQNLYDNIIPSIPYYREDISFEKGYEMLAYAKAGRVKEMLDLLNDVWGEWLRQGNTRFPENFSPAAERSKQLQFYGRPFGLSMCHGANGAPPVLAVLYGILGFSQSDKNISEYTFRPQLLGLQKINARIPVKEGFIDIHFDKAGTSYIEIPAHCIVYFDLQQTGKSLKFNKQGKYKVI